MPAIAGGFFPAWQAVNEERAGVYGQTGGAILFAGDWTPAVAGAAGGAGSAGAAASGLSVGRFASGLLPVQLPGAGTLRVTDAVAGRAARSRIVPVVRKVTKPGSVRVRIKASKAGRIVIRRKGKLSLTLRVAFTAAGSTTAVRTTARITLRRP